MSEESSPTWFVPIDFDDDCDYFSDSYMPPMLEEGPELTEDEVWQLNRELFETGQLRTPRYLW